MAKTPPEKTAAEQEAENAKAAMRNIRNDVARLFHTWDPMALRGLRDWQKQYDPYIAPVAVMVKKRLSALEIADHLCRLMFEEWQLPPDRKKCRELADKMWRTGAFLDGEKAPPA